MVYKNHYDVLEISTNATPLEIKSSYFRLSKKYHPDINKVSNSSQYFQRISEAYQVLGNKRLRFIYDSELSISRHSTDHNHHKPMTSNHNPFADLQRNRKIRVKNNEHALNKDTNIYNFKEYYRCHYGNTINYAKKQEEIRKENIKEWKESTEKIKSRKEASYIYLFILTILSAYLTYFNI